MTPASDNNHHGKSCTFHAVREVVLCIARRVQRLTQSHRVASVADLEA